MLCGFNEEEMLEEEADEVPKNAPEVVGELGNEATEGGATAAEDGTVAAATEYSATAERTSSNLSPDLFHLLAEFDDGKRSCRKRLAGHNERRRKPQLDTLSGKPYQKLLQYHEDARFLRTSLPKRSSFVFSDILPGGFLNPQGNVTNDQGNQNSYIKVKDLPIYRPQFPMPTGNHLWIQFPSENFPSQQTGYNSASTVQESSVVSNSSSAPSLLSAQSQDLSSHLTAIPMGISPVGVSNSMPVIFGANGGIDFEVEASGTFRRSDYVKAKLGPTVDMVQLSSYLQRVEQQRNSMHVKQENDFFCSFPAI